MPIYDGVVTVAEGDIPVIVEVNDELVRLSASGTEIGEWHKDECEIHHIADSTYAITAEEETLNFVPNQPSLFAAAVNGGIRDPQSSVDGPDEPEAEPASQTPRGTTEAPPPRPLTMALFYGLCALTAGLAVWALVSMIFL